MKKTEHFLVLVTLINLGVLAVRFWPKEKPPTTPDAVQEQAQDELAVQKETFFFRAMPDEGRVLAGGIEKPNTPTLILRFSYRNCDLCRRSALNELGKFIPVTGNQYRVFCSFVTERDFKLFQLDESSRLLQLVHVPEDYFGLQLEKDAFYPFFFMLFPDGTARHVFVPMKEDVLRTRRYFEVLHQKFFNTSASK